MRREIVLSAALTLAACAAPSVPHTALPPAASTSDFSAQITCDDGSLPHVANGKLAWGCTAPKPQTDTMVGYWRRLNLGVRGGADKTDDAGAVDSVVLAASGMYEDTWASGGSSDPGANTYGWCEAACPDMDGLGQTRAILSDGTQVIWATATPDVYGDISFFGGVNCGWKWGWLMFPSLAAVTTKWQAMSSQENSTAISGPTDQPNCDGPPGTFRFNFRSVPAEKWPVIVNGKSFADVVIPALVTEIHYDVNCPGDGCAHITERDFLARGFGWTKFEAWCRDGSADGRSGACAFPYLPDQSSIAASCPGSSASSGGLPVADTAPGSALGSEILVDCATWTDIEGQPGSKEPGLATVNAGWTVVKFNLGLHSILFTPLVPMTGS